MLQNLLTAEGLKAAPGQKARNQDTGGNTNSSRKKKKKNPHKPHSYKA